VKGDDDVQESLSMSSATLTIVPEKFAVKLFVAAASAL
jgi:hypothetical protein